MSDDADDDPQLKSLRAVWLALPDEDPPKRGLAELMAAARVKAEQMTTPSLWQRISALLRRPPVLALATVLVLIGGAVFIGQRRDKLASEPTAGEEQRSRDIVSMGSATAVAPEPTKPPETTAEAPATPPAEPTPAPMVESKSEPPSFGFDTPHRTPSRRPEPTNGVSRTDALALDKTKADRGEAKREDAKKIDSTVKVGGATHGTTVEAGRIDDEKQPVSGDSFAPSEEGTAAPPAKDVSPSAQATSDHAAAPPPSRAAQYVAQAKSAAARGDCTVARTMMKRVAKEDAGAYRNALAADSALKKCVGVAAQ